MTSMKTWRSDATAWLAAVVHDNLIEQLAKLRAAVLRAQENHPEDFASNANVKFFRYDSKAKVIVYAWVNDEQTLRSAGSKSPSRRQT